MEMTKGRGPDRCIDAVGAEAHAAGSLDAVLDKAKAAVGLGTDRAHVLREAIMCCRKGGTVSIPGVYVGFPDKIPFGRRDEQGPDDQDGPDARAALHTSRCWRRSRPARSTRRS